MNLLNKIYFPVLIILILAGCKKEHLQEPLKAEPVTWLSAVIDSNTVYYAGGINNYVGSPYTKDSLVRRVFGYSLHNPASTANNIEILINNYNDTLDNEHSDFDNTIQPGNFDYVFLIGGVIIFRPLHVTINWNDGSGHHYSSSYYTTGTQNPASFNISSVENIVKDGLLYKKVAVTFDCKLYDAIQHDTAYVTNGSAILLFGGI